MVGSCRSVSPIRPVTRIGQDSPSNDQRPQRVDTGMHGAENDIELALAVGLDFAGFFNMGSDVSDHEVPAYVARTLDPVLREQLDRALASSGEVWRDQVVVISGPTRSGKTRSLLEALRRCDDLGGTTTMVIVHPRRGDHFEEIHGVIAVLQNDPVVQGTLGALRVVVLIDDPVDQLERGVNLAFELKRLLTTAGVGRIAVALTVPDGWLSVSHETARTRGFRIEDVALLADRAVRYGATLDTGEEITAFEALGDRISSGPLSFDDLSDLPARCARSRDLEAELNTILEPEQRDARAAVLLAALDGSIVEPGGVTVEWLQRVAFSWLADSSPITGRREADEFHQALRWAAAATSSLSPILEFRVTDKEASTGQWTVGRSISPRWIARHRPQSWLEDHLSGFQLWRLAWHYRSQDRLDDAVRCFIEIAEERSSVPGLVPSAQLALADVLLDLDDLPGAERWLATAANGGHLESMSRLALLYDSQGRTDEAEQWRERGRGAD